MIVTGADGFVGSWLVPRLCEEGHLVVAAVRAGATRVAGRPWPPGVEEVEWEIDETASVQRLLDRPLDGVVHLAAVSSNGDALSDPAAAWSVNATGTARLAELTVTRHGGGAKGPAMLLVSSAEVYGVGRGRPRRETDAIVPVSPYAASKAGAEIALLEITRRTGLRGIIARAFAHTGPRQDSRFAIPSFARRIAAAKRAGDASVPVGNLAPVRDILHVSDVVDAYVRLMERGEAGEIYNVASGQGVALADVFSRLSALAGWRGAPKPDAQLLRRTDIAHLVGDASKLTAATGWKPTVSLEETLAEVLGAQAD